MAHSEWRHVSDELLVLDDDLAEVLHEVNNIQHKWEWFAIQLGLSEDRIETAKGTPPFNPNTCLKCVLCEWLKGNYVKYHEIPPSWRSVCQAIARADDNKLACEVAAKHPHKSYLRPYDCGCNKCTVNCNNPVKDGCLPIFSLNPLQKLDDKFKLYWQTEEVFGKFKAVMHKSLKSLQASKVPVASIIELHEDTANEATALQDANDYRELLDYLADKISWFNHDFMSCVRKKFLGENIEIETDWSNYLDDLKRYGEARIEEYEGVEFSWLPTSKQGILSVAIDPELAISLSSIPAKCKDFCKTLGCYAYLYTIRPECIIEFVVPLSGLEKIRSLSEDQLKKLTELDIISLHTADTHVFPELEEWSHVTENQLEMEESLDQLSIKLMLIKEKWAEFSLRLGLSEKTIQNIQKEYRKPRHCLMEAMEVWLKGDYNKFVYGSPNMRRVCAAVASPKGGDDSDLAAQLAKENLTIACSPAVTESLEDDFEKMLDETKECFKTHNDLQGLIACFQEVLKMDIGSEKSLESIFKILKENAFIDVLEISILRNATKMLGYSDALKVLNDYQVKVDKFLASMSLEEYVTIVSVKCKGRKQLAAKESEIDRIKFSLHLDGTWHAKSLERLKKLLYELYEEASQLPFKLSLTQGTMVACVLVHKSLVHDLFQKTDNSRYQLEMSGVVQVLIDDSCKFSLKEETTRREELAKDIQKECLAAELMCAIKEWAPKRAETVKILKNLADDIDWRLQAVGSTQNFLQTWLQSFASVTKDKTPPKELAALPGSLMNLGLTAQAGISHDTVPGILARLDINRAQEIVGRDFETSSRLNEQLFQFYLSCQESTSRYTRFTPEQIYAISLKCAGESVTTDQIISIILKYQNPTQASNVEGFGYLLDTDLLPTDLNKMARADIEDRSKSEQTSRLKERSRQLENGRIELMRYFSQQTM